MPKAPRLCPHTGCTNLIRHTKYCPDHQPAPWQGPRTASSKITSTRAWQTLAKQVLREDRHQCQIRYAGICTGHASAVDKIIPASRRPDLAWSRSNMRAACNSCNSHKGRTEDRL